MAKKKRTTRRYTDEFKREAIRLLENRGDTTAAEIASSLGIAPSILYQWRKQLGSAPERLIDNVSLEEESRRQKQEIARLRRENQTLKKSIALFAKDLDL